MRSSISRVLWLVRRASSFTWSATTAKALPCSPAWAAMMAALSESRFVSLVMFAITVAIPPISPICSARPSRAALAPSVTSRISAMPSIVAPTAREPSSAVSLTRCVISDAPRT